MNTFENTVVMITGPAGNLGSAVVKAFREAGAQLVLVDRHPQRLHELYPDLVESEDHFFGHIGGCYRSRRCRGYGGGDH